MKKADLETHHNAYHVLIHKALSAQKTGLYREAIAFAVSSWNHIDGMTQYQQKYAGQEVTSIQGIDFVLQYAPLMLDFESLDQLETVLRTQRRIAKQTGIDWEHRLDRAKHLMWDACRFWDYLEQHTTVAAQDLSDVHGSERKQWNRIADEWSEMGIVHRISSGKTHGWSLVTHMERPILAKCPRCAAVIKAAKSKCLDDLHCPKCRQKSVFVWLARASVGRE
ncbi:MAG TPA: hypothetical protein VMR25_15795 [Planctomycetaceae bacterium]|jgi:hypothetical protein|nr:hypothetical protein [Planctomycetaceae bacterium]